MLHADDRRPCGERVPELRFGNRRRQHALLYLAGASRRGRKGVSRAYEAMR